ncbi:sigma-70 family RNA polymerase sigma factor [Streptomyces sp. ME02-6979.5a]|uniref:sigma-70 family RNA polymerase sigma factor n=2 Tax=unclassified Streptomyces TaxID=2593676 RepID=UPI0029B4DAF9|nr:sigma-70 family RNA polymerase sigma factor [Streptomyces sp. ME02-6979.5a]MDX3339764.1 sigma-70 family RNA polymerase sigma factor [Streptomyces sp. ME02-6979.5a]
MNGVDSTALVIAARNGDRAAGERLAAQYLPLVYNVVGRALNGHPDVDDVVQETMLRALSGLPSLRDPARFRSWLVAIAMNQVRTRWSGLGHRPAPLEETNDPADPAADFVDLTILRLELSGQRRETAEATRWLDDAERDVLALWWLETTGDLTRSELAEALGLSPQHAAVRVQRVKNQLDVGRTVVRALAADPRCPALEDLLGDWDGTPTPLWRKRIARHVRGCASCSDGSTGLVPPEGLLSGLALVVPLYDSGQSAAAFASSAAASAASAGPTTGSAVTSSAAAPSATAPSASAAFSAGKAAGLIAGAAAVTALAVLIWPSAPAPPEARGGGATHSPAPPPPADAPAEPLPSPSTVSPTPSPSPSRTAAASRPPAATPSPSASPAPGKPRPGPDTGVVTRVNTLRAANGCPELETDPRLTEIAQRHSEDMAAQNYFGHTDSSGRDAGDRVGATGYDWSAVGETIATGMSDPAAVVEEWRNSPGRDDDIFNCDFVHVGVGIADSPRGPYWTQVLATPR